MSIDPSFKGNAAQDRFDKTIAEMKQAIHRRIAVEKGELIHTA